MPMCPYASYVPHTHCNTHTAFPAGAPFGIVLHRTRSTWAAAQRFATVKKEYPHFMIGKLPPNGPYGFNVVATTGGLIQYKDTDFQTAHMHGENDKYIGIEFESEDIPDFNSVPLTSYQISMGKLLISWICDEHGINKYGPPPRKVVNILNRNFHGILSHADIQKGRNPGATTNHGDALSRDEFLALGIEPYPLMVL